MWVPKETGVRRLKKHSGNPGLPQDGNKSELGSLLSPHTWEMLPGVCLVAMAVGSLLSPRGSGVCSFLWVSFRIMSFILDPQAAAVVVVWCHKGFAALWLQKQLLFPAGWLKLQLG